MADHAEAISERAERSAPRPRPPLEPLAEEHAVVDADPLAADLLVPQLGVDRDVLGHRRVRVEPQFAETPASRLAVGELEQRPAEAATVPRRVDRDVVDE